MALCYFQLGYIYHKFADKLSQIRENFKDNLAQLRSLVEDEKHVDYLLGDEHLCKMSACGQYEEAFCIFEDLNHLKGKAVCKRLLAEVQKEIDPEQSEANLERSE